MIKFYRFVLLIELYRRYVEEVSCHRQKKVLMATVLNENIEIYQDYVFSKRKILIQGNVHSDSQRYLKIYYRKLL